MVRNFKGLMVLFRVIHDDRTAQEYEVSAENFKNLELEKKVGYIHSLSKAENALAIFRAYFSGSKVVLFDRTNQMLYEKVHALGIDQMDRAAASSTPFDAHDFSFVFFTSGSTGEPVGALKTKENLESEVAVLSRMLAKYCIKKVVVTVPFIHIYGMLVGLLYPLLNGIDIVLKEHFLPHDLLELVEEGTLVVTTPLYIKALNQLSERKDLSQTLFISSTAPLDGQNIMLFREKFHADVMQLFGSTETGGIAYKMNEEELWTPLEKVRIGRNESGELNVSSPFVSSHLYEQEFMQTKGVIQTFDYIEQEEGRFRLVGRSSKIFKVAGKRYSAIQVEQILEEIEGVTRALVFVERDKEALKGEYLDITLESHKHFTSRFIKEILRKRVSNLKFSIKLNIVDKIRTNQVGKKLRV
jgi:acyl-coenzyme A synthetase/AMP-(fatty) acid ligase